jgi:putative addiction module component (TIGR02574 family)
VGCGICCCEVSLQRLLWDGYFMTTRTERILDEALALPPLERGMLIEKLLASLDQPDASIDELWAREAEDRIDAFEAGKLEAIPAEDVFSKYQKP